WRVIVDYRGHPRYYPRVTAAEVVESDERHVVVRYQVTVHPFSFGFYMDKFPDPRRRRVEWHLADGRSHGLFRENSGYWQAGEATLGVGVLGRRERPAQQVGVMPSSTSSSRAFCQRSHCVPACPPPDGAPLAAPPLMAMPAPESAAAVMIASCSRSTAEYGI